MNAPIEVVATFTGIQAMQMIELADSRGITVAELVHRAAVLDLAETVRLPKVPKNHRGRVDTIALKVGRLHTIGLSDQRMADYLGCDYATVRKKRMALGLPSNAKAGRPRKDRPTPVVLSKEEIMAQIEPAAMSYDRACEIACNVVEKQATRQITSDALIRRLHTQGQNDVRIAAQTGLTEHSIRSRRTLLGLPRIKPITFA